MKKEYLLSTVKLTITLLEVLLLCSIWPFYFLFRRIMCWHGEHHWKVITQRDAYMILWCEQCKIPWEKYLKNVITCRFCHKQMHRFWVTVVFDLMGKQKVYFCENKKCKQYGVLTLSYVGS